MKVVFPVSSEGMTQQNQEMLGRIVEAFNTPYYLTQIHPDELGHLNPVQHYLVEGWRRNLDPAPWFSTRGYLECNPDVVASEQNPFVHYLTYGLQEGRNPLGGAGASAVEMAAMDEIVSLFDEDYYRRQLAGGELFGLTPVQHYCKIGWKLGLDPVSWFSTSSYIDRYPDVAASGHNPFVHYLVYGKEENRDPSKSFAPLPQAAAQDAAPLDKGDFSLDEAASRTDLPLVEAFLNPDYYSRQAPGVDFSVISPAEHYLTVGWRAGLDPSPWFSTNGYLQYNQDVAKAKINPLLHFLRTGKSEARRWGVSVVSRDFKDPESSWIGYNAVQKLRAQRRDDSANYLDEVSFCQTLQGCDLAETVLALSFVSDAWPAGSKPLVSIIIPCLNQETITAECLASIAAALPRDFAIEVIVADNGSTDPLFAVLGKHPDLRVLAFQKNLGFGPACNAAADVATGDYLFFLNNDAQIKPGCLEALLAVLLEDAAGTRIGMVGPKLLFPDGLLQEAGCLLRPDGSGELIGLGLDPNTPRLNYRREVEHISGAAMMLRRAHFQAAGGFDPIYAPAYCEDADLNLRLAQQGLSHVYEPQAVVMHALSVTSQSEALVQDKFARTAANRQVLRQRWFARLSDTSLRTIAFYLPQYHPIPENDRWWGKGFTEWRNIGRAVPNYVGQYQPRLPADLGYYDLRLPEVMDQQIALAKRYGVTGFCFYYYWFHGKRLLEKPLDQRMAQGGVGFPFCLCWANENWTKRWDGKDHDILISQSYAESHALDVVKDFSRYFQSPDYIRVNGRPLFLIYRVQELPNPKRWTNVWRNYCRRIGVGEICIAMVESFGLSAKPLRPEPFGCDIAVEFPPHGMVHDPALEVTRVNPEWTGSVHDYQALAAAYMQREEPGFKRIRTVLAGWDNTPRHQARSLILENATPGAFQAWLEWAYHRTMEQNMGDERVVFINAWNEWCEGNYIEPDQRFGHDYLQSVSNALDSVKSGGASFVEL